MRYGLIAENPFERLALASGQFPTPMLEAYGAAFSRALMVTTKLGVFDTLAGGPLTAREIAAQLGADPRAVEKLLNLLVAMRYVGHHGPASIGSVRLPDDGWWGMVPAMRGTPCS